MNSINKMKNWYYDLPDSKQKKLNLFAIGIALAIILVVTLVYGLFFNSFESDVKNYYDNISQLLDNHLMPYSEYTLEYPPLSLAFLIIPKLLSWNFESFAVFFSIEAVIAAFFCFLFVMKISDRIGFNRLAALLIIILTIVAANKFIVSRNDIFAVLFVVISMYLFMRKNYVSSSILLTCATFIKIYPIILIPIFAIILFTKKDWKNTAIFFIIAAVVGLIIELPFLINDPSSAFAYLTYHSDRGLQVESVTSSLLMIVNLFFPIIDGIEVKYGSLSLIGDIPDAIAGVMDYLLMGALVLSALFMIYRLWSQKNDEKKEFQMLALMSIIIVSIFIIFSKVYSAQYVLWILIYVPMIFIAKGNERKRFCVVFLLFIIFSAISPIFVLELTSGSCHPISEIVIFIKNVLHVILTIMYIKTFIAQTKKNNTSTIVN